MLSALKSEFLKLVTVRSTYILTGLVLLLVTFLSVFVFGYRQSMHKADNPVFMSDLLMFVIGIFVTFTAIIAILLVAHEYRYNTILYTLTSNRSRLKVLAAKALVMLSYATVVGGVVLAVGYFGAKFGLSLQNATLAPQNLPVADLAWRYLVYLWGYALVGIILALLIRGLVGSIVAFFLVPTLEGTLMFVIKENSKYLPFRSLDAIPVVAGPGSITAGTEMLSNAVAAGVFGIYLVIFGSLAIFLFLRRDAA